MESSDMLWLFQKIAKDNYLLHDLPNPVKVPRDFDRAISKPQKRVKQGSVWDKRLKLFKRKKRKLSAVK
jgi:hypothetical protein